MASYSLSIGLSQLITITLSPLLGFWFLKVGLWAPLINSPICWHSFLKGFLAYYSFCIENVIHLVFVDDFIIGWLSNWQGSNDFHWFEQLLIRDGPIKKIWAIWLFVHFVQKLSVYCFSLMFFKIQHLFQFLCVWEIESSWVY